MIWYLHGDPRLSLGARAIIDESVATGDEIGFSSICLAEIVYLEEKARIMPNTLKRLFQELDAPDSVFVELPFDRRVAAVMPFVERLQIPELPDRVIAATAKLHGVPLITADRRIRSSDVPTIW